MSDYEKSGEIMKKVILLIILLMLSIAIIPITAGINKDAKVNRLETSDTDKNNGTELKEAEIDAVISNAMEYITEEYELECKKAVIAICKNNAIEQKNKGEKPKATEISNYSDEFYEELRNLFEEDDTTIRINGKRVYIPITDLCHGKIAESSDYPYIKSVACPWDLQSAEHKKEAEYPCGISINGINSLCSTGLDYKYVLTYFLPQFSIN